MIHKINDNNKVIYFLNDNNVLDFDNIFLYLIMLI